MDDVFNLLNGDYTRALADTRVSRNSIKTRKLSFKSIGDHWRKFKLSMMQSRLDLQKEDLVKDEYKYQKTSTGTSVMDPSSEARLEKRTAAIARLEEKIMVLKKMNVPVNYRANRAIKLKKSMGEKLTYTCGNLYAIKPELYEQVFKDAEVASTASTIDVEKVSAANKEELAKDVNEAMNGGLTDGVVEKQVNAKFADLDKKTAPESFSDKNSVESAVKDAVRQQAEEKKETSEQPKERVHVSQNGSTEARVNHFDSEGARKPADSSYKPMSDDEIRAARENIQRGGYKPMTDEQIAAARKNIEYDQYEEQYRKIWEEKKKKLSDTLENIRNSSKKTTPPVKNDVVRDSVEVTPDRDKKVPEYTTAKTPEKEIHMDYSDATPKDVVRAVDHENTKAGLAELRAEVLRLEAERKKALQEEADASRQQWDVAKRAQEVRKMTDDKKAERDRKAADVAQYCREVQAENERIRRKAEMARGDAECNNRFIHLREEEMSALDHEIAAMDELMNKGPRR